MATTTHHFLPTGSRRAVLAILILSAALAGCAGGGSSGTIPLTSFPGDQPVARAPGANPGTVHIVIFHDEFGRSDDIGAGSAHERARDRIETRLARSGVATEIVRVYAHVFPGAALRLSPADLALVAAMPGVSRIEPDRAIALDPPRAMKGNPGKGKGGGGGGGSDGGGGTVSTQVVPPGVVRVGGPRDGRGRTVFILDTGVDLAHPDLDVDGARARTFILTGADARDANDNHGHGTHVAGIVAALDNSFGTVGVAAGAKVVPVKVLDGQGGGTLSGVIAGVDYVAGAAAPGDAANMSLTGSASGALDDAVRRAAAHGILFALAAGNQAMPAGQVSPARVDAPHVFTVSAVDAADLFASFSNYGNPPVDFAAPGVAIYSTWKGGLYATQSGTSMAAPHAAGVLLLTGGAPGTSGFARGDPDGFPDPIIALPH